MAAQALASAGFFVSVPIFTAPAFDLVAKWGRAIHAIQIKTGHIKPNGKTVQWPTSHVGRFYHKNDCSFFGLVLIPKAKFGGCLLRSLGQGHPCAQILIQTSWRNLGVTLKASKNVIKSVIGFWGIQKTQLKKG